MRRQNRSCDQCRRSKKACDGYQKNYEQGKAFSGIPQDDILPCSYCVKTRKNCSLNPYWVAQSGMPLSPSSLPPTLNGELDILSGTGATNNQSDGISTNSPSQMLGSLYNSLHTPISSDWSASILNMEETIPTDNMLQLRDIDFNCGMDLHIGEPNFSVATSLHDPYQLEDVSSPQSHTDHASHLDFPTPNSNISISSSISSHISDSGRTPDRSRNLLRKRYQTRRQSDSWFDHLAPSIIPDYSGQESILRYNNHLITQSLLQIYHDVLESNLACWLAHDTCPYKMRPRSQMRSSLNEMVSPSENAPTATPESNAVSSKSMYRRVRMLDRMAQSTGVIKLTNTENQAVSKALNLVIMAFGTQWAQGRRRRERMLPKYQDIVDADHQDAVDVEMIDEFEENLQQSLWEQARKALDELSSLESYRIVYAELIFGLIQRPRASGGCPGTSTGGFADVNSSLPHIARILSQDGSPVYTERAGRKMQVLKRHFEASDSGFLGSARTYSDLSQYSEIPAVRLNAEDRNSIGLLYWLAVMFDTVSSSMNERPVVLGDEDCRHDDTYTCSPPTNHRWRLELYAQDDLSKPPTNLSWPCSYDEAIKAVTKSAAVKVLLFRYVSYLQNAIRRQERPEIIEEVIEAAMQAYRYWNSTHGAFFCSLINDYDSIPTKIKSWFPCIHIPWHLGVLLLVDLIEFIDRNGLGMCEASRSRLSTDTTAKIRRSSAMELSDIARVTTPQVDSKSGVPEEQLSGYHFAVNEGSLLTEPWTALLIRAFTKASIFHLSVADDLRQYNWAILGQQGREEYVESLRRCESCVQALWFLGRKSEMASKVSRVLDGLLGDQEVQDHSGPLASSRVPHSAASVCDSVII